MFFKQVVEAERGVPSKCIETFEATFTAYEAKRGRRVMDPCLARRRFQRNNFEC
jgi:hypothetical protein